MVTVTAKPEANTPGAQVGLILGAIARGRPLVLTTVAPANT